jgi:hypothetical protein
MEDQAAAAQEFWVILVTFLPAGLEHRAKEMRGAMAIQGREFIGMPLAVAVVLVRLDRRVIPMEHLVYLALEARGFNGLMEITMLAVAVLELELQLGERAGQAAAV